MNYDMESGGILLKGITPFEFCKRYFGEIDLEELYKNFSLHCDDYLIEVDLEKPSKAKEFCFKVLHDIQPHSKNIKRIQKWILTMKVGVTTHTISIKKINDKQITTPTSMSMSVKEAGLIAMKTLKELIPLNLSKGIYLMTPVCKYIFSELVIEDMAREWNKDVLEVLIILNASCQDGGEYLPDSDGTIATLAVYSTTKNISDRKVRGQICNELVKKYISKGKNIDESMFFKLAKYCTGDILKDLAQINLNPVKKYGGQTQISCRDIITDLKEIQLQGHDSGHMPKVEASTSEVKDEDTLPILPGPSTSK